MREAAERLGLEDAPRPQASQLSGGQRQRVALGRAIVREPAVFLMDEPLSNLDANLRVQMRGEIKRLQRELGTTTVYVTHDQVEAMTMGDRIAIMRDGRLASSGAPSDIYSRPADRFVGVASSAARGMSFSRFAVGADGGGVVLSTAGMRARRSARSRESCPTRSIVGVRPEDAHRLDGGGRAARPDAAARSPTSRTSAASGSPGSSSAEGASFIVGGHEAPDPEIGDTRGVRLDGPAALYLFDPATEICLFHPANGHADPATVEIPGG